MPSAAAINGARAFRATAAGGGGRTARSAAARARAIRRVVRRFDAACEARAPHCAPPDRRVGAAHAGGAARRMNVLAIDQGTSATKALVVGPEGAVLASAASPVRPAFLADGGVEQDPEALWTSVVDAVR